MAPMVRSVAEWGRVAWVLVALAGCQAETTADCAEDLDCPLGTGICVERRCTPMACERRGDCISGACGLDGQCRPDECDPVRTCAEGFACIEGLCRSPRSEGREVGVEIWDSVIPPSPLPPDAFRADAAPPDAARPDARPPRPVDAAPPADAAPLADAGDALTDAAGDAQTDAATRPLLAAFFALTFSFERGDCDARDPATPKDLWVEEAADATLTARMTAPGGGTGLDFAGVREGDALSLSTLVPLQVLPLCGTMVEVRLDGVLDGQGGLHGLADWHTFSTQADCPVPIDCHRYDRFVGAPPTP
jgi:hypothetical protein